jgi:hypothetical protein
MDDLDFLDLSEKAIGSPEGLDRLWQLLDELRSQHRVDAVHACSDLLVSCSALHRHELSRAETLARQLISELPDKRHYLLLARVLDAQGRLVEASHARAEADQRQNLHPGASDEEKAQAMRETLEAARSGRIDKPN